MRPAELPVIFQNNLKAARKLRGLSQHALADRLGMGYVSVNRWENGVQSPTLETIVRIAEALQVTPEALLSEVGAGILTAAGA